jgi:hypothetical protein
MRFRRALRNRQIMQLWSLEIGASMATPAPTRIRTDVRP